MELHSHFNTSDFIILIERWNTTQWNFFIIIIETKCGLLKTPKRGRRRRRRNCQCSQFFQLLAWPRNPRLSLKCLSSSLIPDCLRGYWRGAGLRNEWGRAGAHHPAYYKGHFVARSVYADTKLPFPFMVVQLCSLLHQSNSDVCQQPERVPHNAFLRHKHTGNVESFGSVYAVKSQFVQKWVQVSSHTFARSGSSGWQVNLRWRLPYSKLCES